MDTSALLSVARGDAPADLLLLNASIFNVFTAKIESGSVAIHNGMIAGIGDYTQGVQTIDLKGQYLAPGLIDGHTHLESAMLDVGQYARAVVPHGTSAIVTDLHEIANVCGMDGINYILDSIKQVPLDLFLMAPSCVPATHLETSGASIGTGEIEQLLKMENCPGLGEVMNYPGVIFGDPVMLEKLKAASGKVVDGHAPGVSGKDLSAYVSAGIMSDHESVSLSEAEEKLKAGLRILIREGSSEKNLEALLPLVTDQNYKRCSFVVDDRSCRDLLKDGEIDAVVRKAIGLGMDPLRAIQMATINTAEYFRLNGRGAVAPGYTADLIVIKDLSTLKIGKVFHRGKLVAENGQPLFESRRYSSQKLTNTVNIKPFGPDDLKLKAGGDTFPVIEVVPGQIITRKRVEKVKTEGDIIVSDTGRDILKLVVVERHHASGNIGRGLVTGFNLKKGALASSVAHDSHNIVAVGTTDEDIFTAVKAIETMQGGLVAVEDGKVLADLPLPVAGLLSTEPLESVVTGVEKLENTARQLGSTLPAAFSVLSFLALPVISELRLTDLGVVDVKAFKLIN
ncbi:MAG: adenine deaminase [Dehalococcoidales bacterium]|nr:adenine deaminase [Dehalococcoidales bacterium]